MQSKHLSACYHVACDGMRVIYNHIHKALNASLNCLNFSSVLSHSVCVQPYMLHMSLSLTLCATIHAQKWTDSLYVQIRNSVGLLL